MTAYSPSHIPTPVKARLCENLKVSTSDKGKCRRCYLALSIDVLNLSTHYPVYPVYGNMQHNLLCLAPAQRELVDARVTSHRQASWRGVRRAKVCVRTGKVTGGARTYIGSPTQQFFWPSLQKVAICYVQCWSSVLVLGRIKICEANFWAQPC